MTIKSNIMSATFSDLLLLLSNYDNTYTILYFICLKLYIYECKNFILHDR